MNIKRGFKNTVNLYLDNNQAALVVIGAGEENIRRLEKELDVKIRSKSGHVSIEGPPTKTGMAGQILQELYNLAVHGRYVSYKDFDYALRALQQNSRADLRQVLQDAIQLPGKHKSVKAKSEGQKKYIEAITNHELVFGVGPAGTGKTYLAMAMAVSAYLSGEVKRIILTRPAIEAGEKLGFLPGDLVAKVNPYLRPLYDAMHELLDFEKTQRMLEREEIEVAPLAFMRGRTLNDAFVILDEAQNCTIDQMHMFLTRLGFNSKGVITGDITQIDLPKQQKSGLVHALTILGGIDDIAIHYFSADDVVRHPLVAKIIAAYQKAAED